MDHFMHQKHFMIVKMIDKLFMDGLQKKEVVQQIHYQDNGVVFKHYHE